MVYDELLVCFPKKLTKPLKFDILNCLNLNDTILAAYILIMCCQESLCQFVCLVGETIW